MADSETILVQINPDDIPVEAAVCQDAGFVQPTAFRGAESFQQKYTPSPGAADRKGPGDKFIQTAKRLVVSNYNRHRDREKTPALSAHLVHVVWFAQMGENWTAVLSSPVIRGLLYMVSYQPVTVDGEPVFEARIVVYKMINDVKFIDKDPK